MIVSDIFCVFRPMPYTSQFLNIPSLCLCIVSLSDVKQESLANAKVRISTQQQCTYEGP